MSDPLIEQLDGACLTLTIARPERRNALNAEVIEQLRQALQRAAQAPDIRAVVLTGSGDEAFCAGADLNTNPFATSYAEPTTGYANLLRTARALHVPLIARVNGACMAGGIGLLAMCDLAVSARHATFGLPEVKVGVFPMQVLSVLQSLVAPRTVARLCLTGESVDAAAAQAMGLVNEVADDIDLATSQLVSRIVANAPSAIRRGLYAMKATSAMSFEQAIAFTEGQIGLLAMTQDAREGLSAFKEKRKPNWTGK